MTHHSFSYYQLREQLRRVQALLTEERKLRVEIELELAEARDKLRQATRPADDEDGVRAICRNSDGAWRMRIGGARERMVIDTTSRDIIAQGVTWTDVRAVLESKL